MENLHFALIGVGNIAPIHATAIQNSPGAELVAVATRNEARGRAFVARFGGSWYSDYHACLARDDVDAIAICAPPDLHLPMTRDAADARKHVLCEKPMARNVAECDAMIDACVRAGVTLGVIFQSRFEPLGRRVKTLLDENKIGKLIWSSANTIWYRSDEYYRSGAWRGKLEHEGGGVLINQAIHAVDFMIWSSGMPARVTAQIRTLNHAIEIEDGAIALLEYADGRIGLIQATAAAYPGFPERLEFYGARGSLIYHKGLARIEWHTRDPQEDGEEKSEASSGASRPMDINAAGHTAQFQDFANAIRDQRAPRVDGIEGRRSVALIEAIYRSAREGKTVLIRE